MEQNMHGVTDPEEKCYTIAEAGALLRVSRTTVNRLISTGALHRFKVGRKTFITATAIAAMKSGNATPAPDPLAVPDHSTEPPTGSLLEQGQA